MRAWLLWINAVSGLLFLVSCATGNKHYGTIEQFLRSKEPEKALSLLSQSKGDFYSKNDATLFYLDEALLLFQAGKYNESNLAFEKAEQEIEELFTKSIHKSILSYTHNDTALAFEGEDYEKVLIHFYRMLNYLQLGKREDALVEARKVDDKLQRLQDQYAQLNADRQQSAKKIEAAYTDDALIRYLTGKIYEYDENYDSALISYEKSIQAYLNQYFTLYQTVLPTFVAEDFCRLAHHLGQNQRLERIEKQYGGQIQCESFQKRSVQAEIIILHGAGFAPYKTDEMIDLPFSVSTLQQLFSQGGTMQASSSVVDSILFRSPFLLYDVETKAMADRGVIDEEAVARREEDVAGSRLALNIIDQNASRIALPKFVARTYQINNLSVQAEHVTPAPERVVDQNSKTSGSEKTSVERIELRPGENKPRFEVKLNTDFPETLDPNHRLDLTSGNGAVKVDPNQVLKPASFSPPAMPTKQLEPIVYGQIAEDLTAIAKRNLKDRYPIYIRRAIGRFIFKQIGKFLAGTLVKSNQQNSSFNIASFAMDVYGKATEVADKRSWRMLPAKYNVARLWLDPGSYRLNLNFYGREGTVMETDSKSVSVRAGEKVFVYLRSFE